MLKNNSSACCRLILNSVFCVLRYIFVGRALFYGKSVNFGLSFVPEFGSVCGAILSDYWWTKWCSCYYHYSFAALSLLGLLSFSFVSNLALG
jgi:hypothetical protein